MDIIGWIIFVLLAGMSSALIVILSIPFITSEVKMIKEKIDRAVKDRKLDLEKRSEDKRRRDALKREKDAELANLKLANKINRIDKQLDLARRKNELTRRLRAASMEEIPEYEEEVPAVEEEQVEQRGRKPNKGRKPENIAEENIADESEVNEGIEEESNIE